MFVIQSGTVEVVRAEGDHEIVLAEFGPDDFFGEMALFARASRSATVRARGDVTVLTVDRRTLLGRIQKAPTLAFRILERMSARVHELDRRYGQAIADDRGNGVAGSAGST